MSNMLDQAIIDAEALKEAAIKNAEAAIVEKYSADIKQAVNQLLEQPSPEDVAMLAGSGMQAPPGTAGAQGGMDGAAGEHVGEVMGSFPAHVKSEQTVHLKLGELMAEMKMDDLNPKEKQVRELVAEEVTGGEEVAGQEGEETITIQESVIADILGEMLDEDVYEEGEDLEEQSKTDTPDRVAGRDTGGRRLTPLEEEDEARTPEQEARIKRLQKSTNKQVSGMADIISDEEGPTTTNEALHQHLQAYEQNYAQLYESHQTYEYNYSQLHQQAGQLHEQNNKFRELLIKTQEKLNEVNVQNAQLYYTNRTLTSDSLNERQKDKIVEAIKRTGTVEEAKIIFETLQSTVAGSKPNQNTPKSLNEAINKRSSAFLPREREETQSAPTLVDRMQKLAGIK
jgi:hypothetical protein